MAALTPLCPLPRVPKAREGGSLRRPLRVGFLTLPAPQERGPRPCAPGMAPRSLSCHAVGLPDSGVPLRPPGPRTGPPEGRGLEAPPAKRGGEWGWGVLEGLRVAGRGPGEVWVAEGGDTGNLRGRRGRAPHP